MGPTTVDNCTGQLAVPVPLRSRPTGYRSGKVTLRVLASGYSGAVDKDKLKLVCLSR